MYGVYRVLYFHSDLCFDKEHDSWAAVADYAFQVVLSCVFGRPGTQPSW